MSWKVVSRIALAAGGLSLAGCYPLAQGPSSTGTAMLSPAPVSSYALMYGEVGSSSGVAPAPRRKAVATAATGPTTSSMTTGEASAPANDPIVFSDEWRKRENETETKLSRATKICRC
jgi:hypothetical protein